MLRAWLVTELTRWPSAGGNVGVRRQDKGSSSPEVGRTNRTSNLTVGRWKLGVGTWTLRSAIPFPGPPQLVAPAAYRRSGSLGRESWHHESRHDSLPREIASGGGPGRAARMILFARKDGHPDLPNLQLEMGCCDPWQSIPLRLGLGHRFHHLAAGRHFMSSIGILHPGVVLQPARGAVHAEGHGADDDMGILARGQAE